MNLFYVSYFEVKLVKSLSQGFDKQREVCYFYNAMKIRSFFQKNFFKRKRKERVPEGAQSELYFMSLRLIKKCKKNFSVASTTIVSRLKIFSEN